MALNELLAAHAKRLAVEMGKRLPGEDIHPVRLHQAMRYAVLDGGKRVRPALVYLSGSALGVPLDALDAAACAVEFIHAYSLVHDDLPAMDDDDLRRGKPTCHKAFDEATAILVGDGLQTLAFHTLAHDSSIQVDAPRRLELIEALAVAAGSRGMVGGQAIDIDAVGKQLNLAELEDMHIHKTGALIRASVKLGALCQANLDRTLLDKLDHYAKCIGLAFQIQDDILDVESDTETLGKTQGHDMAQGKPTYPALVGLPEAKKMAADLLGGALASLEPFDEKADPLRWMADYIVTRRN